MPVGPLAFREGVDMERDLWGGVVLLALLTAPLWVRLLPKRTQVAIRQLVAPKR